MSIIEGRLCLCSLRVLRAKGCPVAVSAWPACLAFAALVAFWACWSRLLCFLLPPTADRSVPALARRA
jgi:hypothetical protein